MKTVTIQSKLFSQVSLQEKVVEWLGLGALLKGILVVVMREEKVLLFLFPYPGPPLPSP